VIADAWNSFVRDEKRFGAPKGMVCSEPDTREASNLFAEDTMHERWMWLFLAALLASAAISTNAAAQDVATSDPFAIVNSNGTFEDGRRIISTFRLGAGVYEVITNRVITRCVCLITLGNPTSFGVGNGFGTCVQRAGSAGRGWFIQIFDHAGSLVDREFMVMGGCRP
jgi:hypothetical protein